jgi:ABC-2 type transport system ATP-binding protein
MWRSLGEGRVKGNPCDGRLLGERFGGVEPTLGTDMIEVVRVSKYFGKHRAVDDVSLTVRPGVVTGLLGPNGAGKTTLIRMMTSYLAPSLGTIRVFGHDALEEPSAARACIGSLNESAPLYPEMRVGQYLKYRAGLYGVSRSARAAAIEAALRRCALSDVASKRIGQLSKGYRQRVGLAATTLHDPRVLILDEPSSGLDPSQIRDLRSTIRTLASPSATRPEGRAVLLSSHYLPEVQATCDEIVIMARGRVRAQGTPGDITRSFGRAAPYEVVIETPPGLNEADEAALMQRLRAVLMVNGAAGVTIEPRALGQTRVRCSITPRVVAESDGTSSSVASGAVGLSADGERDLGEAIFKAVSGAGLSLSRLSRREATLEQVFISVVEGSNEHAAAVSQGSAEVAA